MRWTGISGDEEFGPPTPNRDKEKKKKNQSFLIVYHVYVSVYISPM